VKTDRYRPVHRGVYAIGPLSPRGRMVAALLAGGPGAALGHASALVAHGLMKPRPTIDVATRTNRRDSEHVRFHRLTLDARETTTTKDGLKATRIERTLLDLAATGAPIDRVAHKAIAKRLTTQRRLADTADRPLHRRLPVPRAAARHRDRRDAPPTPAPTRSRTTARATSHLATRHLRVMRVTARAMRGDALARQIRRALLASPPP
jgi:hypothetical protein